MPNESTSPVAIPRRVVANRTPITAAWANSVRKAIGDLSNRGIPTDIQLIKPDTLPPLTPNFYGKESSPGDYFFTVTRGLVIDHNPAAAAANAVLLNSITNIFTAGISTEFEIHDGEAGFVKVTLSADWSVSAAVIWVGDKDTVSTNPSGAYGGIHYYKLLSLAIVADAPVVTYYADGDHIWHYRQKAEQGSASGATGSLQFEVYGGDGPFTVLEWVDGKITTTGDWLVTMSYSGALSVSDVTPP